LFGIQQYIVEAHCYICTVEILAAKFLIIKTAKKMLSFIFVEIISNR